ncbi:MAG: hypothetical protein M3N41_06650 [Acidobacteriota bacterium]|nr:hypothetical protein [Acidobacteriota bacterium]
MSHSDEDYDHPIAHHDPKEGFDRSEPNTPAIWLFTVGSIIGLVLVIVAVQGYFEQIYKDAVSERVLTVPSELLQDVRNRDAWNLSHYMYGDLDKSSNRVRMPIDKAMQTFAAEAAAGKLFYPAKATAIKKEEPDAAATPAGATPAAATPAAATPEPAKK